MEQKLILAIYFPAQMEIDDANNMIQTTNEHLLKEYGDENKPIVFFMPVEDNPRIECLNPVVLNEEQFEEYDQIITSIKESEDYKKLINE